MEHHWHCSNSNGSGNGMDKLVVVCQDQFKSEMMYGAGLCRPLNKEGVWRLSASLDYNRGAFFSSALVASTILAITPLL